VPGETGICPRMEKSLCTGSETGMAARCEYAWSGRQKSVRNSNRGLALRPLQAFVRATRVLIHGQRHGGAMHDPVGRGINLEGVSPLRGARLPSASAAASAAPTRRQKASEGND
jgi:hypothetical protein